jgi:hypothetical protein
MNKGARAMVAACMYPDPEKGGRGQKALIAKEFTGIINQGSLSQARTVLALAPDLVPEVKTGERSLADAYKTAQDRKKAAEDKEQRRKQLRPVGSRSC